MGSATSLMCAASAVQQRDMVMWFGRLRCHSVFEVDPQAPDTKYIHPILWHIHMIYMLQMTCEDLKRWKSSCWTWDFRGAAKENSLCGCKPKTVVDTAHHSSHIWCYPTSTPPLLGNNTHCSPVALSIASCTVPKLPEPINLTSV